MQAILLAAGKGVRMHPATLTTPKPLLQVNNTSILEYVLQALPSEINEIILVVNYLQEQIKTQIGETFQNKPITYITQDPLTGTAGALISIKHLIRGRFLVLNADNIYDPTSVSQLLNFEQSLLVKQVPFLLNAAAQTSKGLFTGLSTCTQVPCAMVCGAYVLNQSFFELSPIAIQVGSHTEFGLPQTLAQSKQPIHVVTTDYWLPIGTPEEWQQASLHART